MEVCSECHYTSDLHKKEKHDDGDCLKCHDGTPGEGNVEPGTCIICHPTDDPGMCSLVNGHGGSCLECHFNCAEGMTTTTIINTSSTTTVTQPCPSTLALQRDIERLQTLRAFRDEVLCTSTLGKTYTDLYYQYAPEISLMMLSDEGLRLEAAEVLGNLLPEIEAIMIDGEGTISAEVIAEVESLLDNFAANASPELKSVIKIVKADVERGKIVGGAIVKKLLDSDHPPP
jgi:hypothetical protein